MPIKRFIQHPWFHVFDLGCVFISSLLWYSLAGSAWWPILIALAPWFLRLMAGFPPIQRTHFDPALAVFLITAGAGVWSAYNHQAAWSKFWLMIASILLFYALACQPRQNLWLLVGLFCLLGVAVAGVFLLVHDWRAQPADLGLIYRVASWWMSVRSQIPGRILAPNKVGGILAILFPFTLAFAIYAWRGWLTHPLSKLMAVLSLVSAGMMGLGLLMTSSRGAWMALSAGLGLWLLGYLSQFFARRWGKSLWIVLGLSLLVILFLSVWIISSYAGEVANLSGRIPGYPSGPIRYDIYENTLHLVGDFPWIGGGLGSFAGLFSHYMLVIPFFLFSYSHNFYLDMMLEQGWLGFLSVAFMYLGSAYLLIRKYLAPKTSENDRLLIQAILVSLMIVALHGFIDDPIYSNRGTPLLFLLPGLAVVASRSPNQGAPLDLTENQAAHPQAQTANRRAWKMRLILPVILLMCASLVFFWPNLRSAWLANFGAVLMARQQLADFPSEQWTDIHSTQDLSLPESYFKDALAYNPQDRTANHRLGLIAMQEGDFQTAVSFLEVALKADKNHRGIVKNLGYSYLWLGQFDQAQALLERLPEARLELTAYSDWWKTQGRNDLAAKAAWMSKRLSLAN